VDVPDLPHLACAHTLAGLLDERIEANVEVRGMDEPRAPGELDELGGLVGRDRQRLLADHVFPRLERLLRLRVVQVVRRCQVDDVDSFVREHSLVGVVDGARGGGARPFGRRAGNAQDLDPEAPERVDVHRADEARADDSRLELVERLQLAGSRRRASRVLCRTTRSVRRTCLRASAPARLESPARIASTIGTWNSASSS